MPAGSIASKHKTSTQLLLQKIQEEEYPLSLSGVGVQDDSQTDHRLTGPGMKEDRHSE